MSIAWDVGFAESERARKKIKLHGSRMDPWVEGYVGQQLRAQGLSLEKTDLHVQTWREETNMSVLIAFMRLAMLTFPQWQKCSACKRQRRYVAGSDTTDPCSICEDKKCECSLYADAAVCRNEECPHLGKQVCYICAVSKDIALPISYVDLQDLPAFSQCCQTTWRHSSTILRSKRTNRPMVGRARSSSAMSQESESQFRSEDMYFKRDFEVAIHIAQALSMVVTKLKVKTLVRMHPNEKPKEGQKTVPDDLRRYGMSPTFDGNAFITSIFHNWGTMQNPSLRLGALEMQIIESLPWFQEWRPDITIANPGLPLQLGALDKAIADSRAHHQKLAQRLNHRKLQVQFRRGKDDGAFGDWTQKNTDDAAEDYGVPTLSIIIGGLVKHPGKGNHYVSPPTLILPTAVSLPHGCAIKGTLLQERHTLRHEEKISCVACFTHSGWKLRGALA